MSNESEESTPPAPPVTNEGAEEASGDKKDAPTNGKAAAAADHHHHKDNLSLNGSWTLWFDNPRLAPPGSDWKENLKTIATFSSMDAFWGAFNNMLPPSQIGVGSNYSIFREGIEPAWEHPLNMEGGKFVLTLSKKDNNTGKLDEYWLYTILAVLGEMMDKSGSDVNGAVVSIRKSQNRIALWLKESSPPEHCIMIAERWKKALEIEKIPVKFQAHKDAAKSGHSFHNEILIEV